MVPSPMRPLQSASRCICTSFISTPCATTISVIGSRSLTSSSGSDGGNLLAACSWLAGSTLAVMGAGLIGLSLGADSSCLADSDSKAAARNAAKDDSPMLEMEQLRSWLVSNGADLGHLEIKKSKTADGVDCGYGLFVPKGKQAKAVGARTGWWPFQRAAAPLAYFPLSSAITAENIMKDPELGRGYGWMVGQGLVDENTVILSYLAVQRAKGTASPLYPWIRILPQSFQTPLYFTPVELEELKGTTLYRAASTWRTHLAAQWEKLEPTLTVIATQSAGSATGSAAQAPTFDDYLWAYSVFWSRGMGVPIPQEGKVASESTGPLYQVVDAIVPGLDLANHSVSSPQCWWEVVGASRKPQTSTSSTTSTSSASAPTIQLHMNTGMRAQAGSELMISYGNRSNEELLMLYGFAVESNPNDMVMLAFPIPPSSAWDDVMHARMRLMRTLNLKPQVFLHATALPAPTAPTSRGKGRFTAVVPQEVLDNLEIFVLDFKELNVRMRAAQQILGEDGEAQQGDAGVAQRQLAPKKNLVPLLDMNEIDKGKHVMSVNELQVHWQRLGLRMASLTTLVRLLELHVISLEGDEGTGSLEEDETLISQGPQSMPYRKWASLVYRYGQKRITREFMQHARTELQDVIQFMSELYELKKSKTQEEP